MIKALFVDDDRAILDGLDYLIDWKANGVTIVGHAYDGIEGIRKIEELRPDLLITDIRMPGYNGLEMISRLLSLQIGLKIIIISGFDDFAYARQAIELGVSAYLLKPVKRSELVRAVNKITGELQEERSRSMTEQARNNKISVLSSLAREKYFMDLLSNSSSRADRIDFALIGFDSPPPCFALLLVEPAAGEPEALALLRDQFSRSPEGSPPAFLSGSRLILLFSGEDENSTWENLKKGLSRLEELKNFSFFGGCSRIHGDWDSLGRAFREAEESLGDVFVPDQVRFYEELRQRAAGNSLRTLPRLEGIVQSVRELDRDGAFRETDILFDSLAENNCRTSQYYLEAVNLFLLLGKTLVRMGKEGDYFDGDRLLNALHLQTSFRTRQSLVGCVKECLARIMDGLEDNPRYYSAQIVQNVKDYLDQKCTGESRESLAERFNISPSYLSRIFKEETGMNLVNYLTEKKIEQAKERLLYSSDQIQEISDSLGYASAHYFTKVFEKYTGLSPSRYRRQGKER